MKDFYVFGSREQIESFNKAIEDWNNKVQKNIENVRKEFQEQCWDRAVR